MSPKSSMMHKSFIKEKHKMKVKITCNHSKDMFSKIKFEKFSAIH